MKSFEEFAQQLDEDTGGALKYVKKEGDNYFLVSKYTGKHLKDFGTSKPSREEADKALGAVEYFKHGG